MMNSLLPKPILVRSSAGDYSVLCSAGLLRQTQRLVDELGSFSSLHILSSSKVWKALGSKVLQGFGTKNAPQVHLIDDAETAKTLSTVEKGARLLARAGADRHCLVIAVGGGVIGDVAGFVAASYLRGVSLLQVPTTLVAQVDSAVGGKTGVNLPEGKNLVGAFYPAKLVLVDPQALTTLPDRAFRSGLAEVIKYGMIADAALFHYLERNLELVLQRNAGALEQIIRRSLEIKADVVSRDERESGLREKLNFGHTFGHALETATNYKVYHHGEAVNWGMICAGLLGQESVGTPADDVRRLIALIRRAGRLPGWPKTSAHALLQAMRSDKKARGGKLRFVLCPAIGQAACYDSPSPKLVHCILQQMSKHSRNPDSAIGNCHG